MLFEEAMPFLRQGRTVTNPDVGEVRIVAHDIEGEQFLEFVTDDGQPWLPDSHVILTSTWALKPEESTETI